jgi:CRISPR-associated protein Csm4
MKTVTLRPDGPFSERPRSDTVFGAVCWGLRLTHGEEALEDVLLQFANDEPPFRLSSAYPVIQPNDAHGRIHLFPRPYLPIQSAVGDDASTEAIEALQRWEQLKYVPEKLFGKVLDGTVTSDQLITALSGDRRSITIDGVQYEINEEFLLPARVVRSRSGDRQRPLLTAERVRNAVNRLSNATEGRLFQEQSVYTADGVALAVAVEGDVETALTGLAAIQDHGIGGGKSVGKGTYELGAVETLELSVASGGPSCTLSLCVPREEAIDTALTDGFYDIETRKGVIESSLASGTDIWKRQVVALTEGAVLPPFDGHVGYNPIVADRFEHGVQQFGYEFPVQVADSVVSAVDTN